MNEIKRFEASIESMEYEDLVDKAFHEVQTELDNIESGRGIGNIFTGVHAIDIVLQGICPGMMDVYAAEAGCGKTSLIEMVSLKFLLEGHPVVIFQRDMTPMLFYFRLACRLAEVSVSYIRRYGSMNVSDVKKVRACSERIRKTPIALYSPSGCTGEDVKKIVAKESRNKGVKLAIIDHVRSLRHTKNSSWDGIEENSKAIRDSTSATGIPHLVLAHINREGVKSDRPTISHIKGGDQLKDDSDNCCVMWAPEGRPEREAKEQTWKVSFGFDKTRWDWGGTETMIYNGPKMKFEKIGPAWSY